MTDNEIIRALECCRDAERYSSFEKCLGCPAGEKNWERCDFSRNCIDDLLSKSIDLINRQSAKIKALEMDNQQLECDIVNANMNLDHMNYRIKHQREEIKRLHNLIDPLKQSQKRWKETAKRLRAELHKKRSTGCEFCDNGEHLSMYDKYGNGYVGIFKYCPVCGRELEQK